jgi:hypothetical protein
MKRNIKMVWLQSFVAMYALATLQAGAANEALLFRIDNSNLTLDHGQSLLFKGVQLVGDTPENGTLVRRDVDGSVTTFTADSNGFISVDQYITEPTEFALPSCACACDRRLGNLVLDLVQPPRVSETYSEWIALYPTMGSETNYLDNPDGDAGNNILEYAFGGNPTNADVIGLLPGYALVNAGEISYIYYTYYKRSDSWLLGLTYTLELTEDLSNPAWTNTGYEVLGSVPYDGVFNAVSNRVATTNTSMFIRLKIEMDKNKTPRQLSGFIATTFKNGE